MFRPVSNRLRYSIDLYSGLDSFVTSKTLVIDVHGRLGHSYLQRAGNHGPERHGASAEHSSRGRNRQPRLLASKEKTMYTLFWHIDWDERSTCA